MNNSVHRKRDYRIGKRAEDFALRDPPCAHCRDPVMSRHTDGRGRHAHLVCLVTAERRAERVSPRHGPRRARTMGGWPAITSLSSPGSSAGSRTYPPA